MYSKLNGKVVLITGSTGGLGRAAARALRNKGAKLALLDLDLAAVQSQANELGGPDVAAGWVADVTSLSSLESAFAQVADYFGSIDIVIANAGIGVGCTMEALDPETFERTIDINLTGVWRTFRASLPYVQASRGYLLAVSSMAAFVHSPLNTHYTASKAGVWAMCDSLRLELKHLGVGVGSIHPTFFKTPMMDAIENGPCSQLVWNQHRGMWRYVPLQEVVDDLVDGIERRKDLIVVPKRNAIVARMPTLLRKFIEKVGFNDERVAQAVRESRGGAAS
ncbi:MAG: SDR family NAD(P)-dependent oxidoreductase [Pseudomonadales bacterium]|nr:SDR family NAD(P)-dependent oxidoreductase [Pseudomonadales bacterium]